MMVPHHTKSRRTVGGFRQLLKRVLPFFSLFWVILAVRKKGVGGLPLFSLIPHLLRNDIPAAKGDGYGAVQVKLRLWRRATVRLGLVQALLG